MTALILPLKATACTLETVGGKGASLARMAAAGLPVPTGFHITTAAYCCFVTENKLQSKILEAVAATVIDQSATFEKAAAEIKSSFAMAAMPADIASAIGRAYAELGDADLPVAVRSSATAEDLPDMSFAGQYESYLNQHGEAQVLSAVKQCWASLWTARAIDYRARNGIAPELVSLAVLVQKLILANASGIMFTANPLTGAGENVVINAAWGMGEAVVGGKVTPDTIVVNKISGKIIEQRLGQKAVMTVRTPDGTCEATVPVNQRMAAVLSPSQAATLAHLGTQIEALYGQATDIEWARDHDQFFIVQARPITIKCGHNPALGEWNDSLTGDYLWTNANYGEAAPDVMTPCTWSITQLLLDNADPSVGPYCQYGNIGGRLYSNLSTPASLAATFGIKPKRFARIIEDGFGRLPEGLEIPVFPVPRWSLLRMAIPVAIRALFRMRANHKKMPAFLQSTPARCETLHDRIQATTSETDLIALWHNDIEPLFFEACHMLESAANQGGGALVTIRLKLRKLVGDDDANILLTGLSTHAAPLASLGPLLSLTQLANGEIDRAIFIRQYGHRGPHEMELSIPRPAEDPNWIDQQLAGLRQTQDTAAVLIARQTVPREAAWKRLYAADPRKAAAIHRQIERWATIARDREAVRSELVRVTWIVRTFIQRTGALTNQSESIFFLSLAELLALLVGDQTSLATVPARRAAYARYCALPRYPTLICGHFDPFQWAADPERRSDIFDASGGHTPAAAITVTGFPGASGVVEGLARVITTVEDGGQLQTGEVLVTTVTNIGWTMLFPRAAAVVTDVGAPLSHAAIVARELGIPAVVGCGNATMRIKTGDRLRVNGSKGLVEIL